MLEQSRPIEYQEVLNTYTKGGMYCIYFNKGEETIVHKYPLVGIFRVEENY